MILLLLPALRVWFPGGALGRAAAQPARTRKRTAPEPPADWEQHGLTPWRPKGESRRLFRLRSQRWSEHSGRPAESALPCSQGASPRGVLLQSSLASSPLAARETEFGDPGWTSNPPQEPFPCATEPASARFVAQPLSQGSPLRRCPAKQRKNPARHSLSLEAASETPFPERVAGARPIRPDPRARPER